MIFSYSVGPAARKSFASSEDWAGVFDGILLPKSSIDEAKFIEEPLKHIVTVRSKEGFECEGEFSVAWVTQDELFSYSNVGGSHSLYVTETSNFVAISNRSSCLLGLPGVSADRDDATVGWKAFHGYAYGNSTAFASIKKLINGTWASVSRDGGLRATRPSVQSLIDPITSEAFKSDPKSAIYNEIDRISRYMKRSFLASETREIDVSLSGGKDSRVLLALTQRAGLIDSVSKIWTRGPHYSPEVLAAIDLCNVIGYNGHRTERPALFSSSQVTAGGIVRSIALQDGMLSLYDITGITRRTDFRFQGHELGLRAGRFADAGIKNINEFADSAINTWRDPVAVVRSPAAKRGSLRMFFEEAHASGVSIENLGDLYSVFERLPSWAAVMSLADYCGGAISNPLLEGGVIRFAFSIPAQFRRAEVFHYLALARCSPNMLAVPFAEQVWPRQLPQVLSELGVDFVGVPPYRSSPHFPNVKNPYISNVKLDLFEVLKPIVAEFIQKHCDYFDEIIDVQKFIEQQRSVSNPSFIYLYACLGIYSAVLIEEYGAALFDLTQQADVILDLQARMDAARQQGYGENTAMGDQVWPEIVERHERAIAGLVRGFYESQSVVKA
jgi:hypothetical protein